MWGATVGKRSSLEGYGENHSGKAKPPWVEGTKWPEAGQGQGSLDDKEVNWPRESHCEKVKQPGCEEAKRPGCEEAKWQQGNHSWGVGLSQGSRGTRTVRSALVGDLGWDSK